MLKTAIHNTASGDILRAGYIGSEHRPMRKIDDVSDFFRLLYVVDGTGVFIDNAGNKTELTPGILVQRLPGLRHSVIRRTDGRWLEFFLLLPRALYAGLSADGFIQSDRWILQPGKGDDIRQRLDDYVEAIANFNHNSPPARLLEKTIAIFSLFYTLDAGRLSDSPARQRMRRAAAMLENDLRQRISLSEVAFELGISTDHFRKEFSREYGVSPKRYRIMRRLEQARMLLCDQSSTIEQIAEEMGYPDQFTFSRQFKIETGMSPSVFRRQIRQ